MCVIAFSPKNSAAPTETQIRQMFKKNPDGAGYAYEEGGKVKFKKGFMNVESLLAELKPLNQWTNKDLAIHFRIGTAGKNDQKTTHPFPLSDNFGELRKLEGEGPVLFHNGVISGLGGLIDPLSSDTQDFVAGVATRFLNKPKQPSKVAKTIIEDIIGSSKLLVMHGKNRNIMFGKWEQLDGVYYSNLYWKPTEQTCWYGGYSQYDYESACYRRFDLFESDYAWPSYYHQWIKTNAEQGQKIANAFVRNEDGTYRSKTSSIAWKTNEDKTEWWSVELEEQASQTDEELPFEECWMDFNNNEELVEYLKDKKVEDVRTIKVDNVNWYIDSENLAIFRKEALDYLTLCEDKEECLSVFIETGVVPRDDDELEEIQMDYREYELYE